MSANPLAFDTLQRGTDARSPNPYAIATACLAVALLLILLPPIALGPNLEGRLFPIFSYQAIPASSVTRTDHLLCWDWIRDKKRAPPSINIDVSLETADGDRYAPEIFDARSGLPWHKGGALPPGSYVSQFCTKLPPSIADTTPVRLRQELSYEGFLGLWTLRVSLPTVLSN